MVQEVLAAFALGVMLSMVYLSITYTMVKRLERKLDVVIDALSELVKALAAFARRYAEASRGS